MHEKIVDIETETTDLSEQDNSDPEWYRKWFNTDYLQLYRHRSSDEAENFVQMLIVKGWLNPEGRILDIACGAGRYMISLLSKGVDIYGIDLSKDLLSIAKSKMSRMIGSRLVRSDMRLLPFRQKFDAAMSLFTSFGYFSDPDNLRVIEETGRVLKTGGIFILDYFNYESVVNNLRPISIKRLGRIIAEERRRYDVRSRRITKTVILYKENKIEEFFESVRCYTLDEVIDFFQMHNFQICKVYGDYEGGDYRIDKQRMIIIGRKK